MTLPGEFNHSIIAYTSDNGTTYTYSQKTELATLVANTIVPYRFEQAIPERWRLRTITIATVYGGRYYTRRIVIGSNTNPLYIGFRNSVDIQGVTWRVIGRTGEYRRGPAQAS